MRLSKSIEVYLQMLKDTGRSIHTISNYERDLRFFRTSLDEDPRLKDVNKNHIRQFITYLHDRGNNNRSTNRRLDCLRGFFKYHVMHGNIAVNPIEKTRRLKEAKKLPVFLDQIQAAAFMEAPRSMKGRKNRPCEELILRNLAILEILYGSGMRISALVNLRVTDVDLDMMTITCYEKGGNFMQYYLTDCAKEALIKYLEVRKKFVENKIQGKIKLKKDKDNTMFLGRSGTKLTPRAVQLILQRYCRQLGLGKITPHTLRHSFATALLENGWTSEPSNNY